MRCMHCGKTICKLKGKICVTVVLRLSRLTGWCAVHQSVALCIRVLLLLLLAN